VFLALNSIDFCNTYLFSTPQEAPFVDLQQFCFFWGILNFSLSLLILLFKDELGDHQKDSDPATREEPLGFTEVYKMVWKLFQLPHFRTFVGLILLTKIGFFVSDNIVGLALIDKGFSQT
jgi:PAT family acetyl-CoA transporter-like MFS transporter 1